MRSLVLADRGVRPPVAIAEVNSRDGFLLLAREPVGRRALTRALHWMARSATETIADLVAADFPKIPPAILRKVVARLHGAGTWAAGPRQAREPFERFGRILAVGGLITTVAPFQDLVDDHFAEAAVRSLVPDCQAPATVPVGPQDLTRDRGLVDGGRCRVLSSPAAVGVEVARDDAGHHSILFGTRGRSVTRHVPSGD